MVVILATSALTARADSIVYDNGPPSLSPSQVTLVYSLAQANANKEAADDFILSAGHTAITQINWWGTYDLGGANVASPASDNFTIKIYNNVLSGYNQPGSVAATISPITLVRTDTGSTIDPFATSPHTLYEYTANILPLTLRRGLRIGLA